MKKSIRKILFSMFILMITILPLGITQPVAASAPAAVVACSSRSTSTYKPRFVSTNSAIEFGGSANCLSTGAKAHIRMTFTLYKNNVAFTTQIYTCYAASSCSQAYHINNIASVGTWYTIVKSEVTGTSSVSVQSSQLIIRLTSKAITN